MKKKLIKRSRSSYKRKNKKTKSGCNKLHAFRADPELTSLLDSIPNKSEFIVQSLREQCSKKQLILCPRCKGRGRIFT